MCQGNLIFFQVRPVGRVFLLDPAPCLGLPGSDEAGLQRGVPEGLGLGVARQIHAAYGGPSRSQQQQQPNGIK